MHFFCPGFAVAAEEVARDTAAQGSCETACMQHQQAVELLAILRTWQAPHAGVRAFFTVQPLLSHHGQPVLCPCWEAAVCGQQRVDESTTSSHHIVTFNILSGLLR